MWFFTCETHVHSWGVSHVKFHMWLFTCVSHVKFHMGFFTCEISHVKFHIWNSTCEISYVNCHMWYFTCEQSYMIKMCNFICQSSHGKINMWYSPCEFSKVKFLMVGHFSCEISPMTSFLCSYTCSFPIIKFQMQYFTCKNHMWKVTYELSHVEFQSLLTCRMWNFTFGISRVEICHTWSFTCEISHVKFHMWYFTCEEYVTWETHGFWDSHVLLELHMWITCESHGKHITIFCKGWWKGRILGCTVNALRQWSE